MPHLTGAIDILDDLAEAGDLSPEQLDKLAKDLAPFPAELASPDLDRRLESFGFGRRTEAPKQLAPKVAALAVLAETGEMDAVTSYIGSRDYQETLLRARDVAYEICAPEAEGGWSPYAELIIILTGSGGLGRVERDPVEVARDLGFIFLLLIGIAGFVWYRIRKMERERRANKRSACLIPVKVKENNLHHDLELVDISQAGANIRNELEWEVEHRVTVDIEDLTRKATVRWSNAHYAGVLFDEQIERDHFELLLSRYPPPPEPEEDDEELHEPQTKRGPETGAA